MCAHILRIKPRKILTNNYSISLYKLCYMKMVLLNSHLEYFISVMILTETNSQSLV
jgi:hypothetical protein